MWSNELLSNAQIRVDNLRSALSRNEVAPIDQLLRKIVDALADDLNTPLALSLINEWVDGNESGKSGGSIGELSRFLDSTLGLAL